MFSRFRQPAELTPAERHQFVDSIMQETQAVLANEQVQAKLGARAIRLTELAHDYFVPNIRHGIVTIPNKYLDTDSLAILPSLEEPLLFGTDFNHTTPARRRRLTDTIESVAPGRSESLIAALDKGRLVAFPLPLPENPPAGAFVCRAIFSGVIRENNQKTKLTLPSREIVFFRRGLRVPESPLMCHELTHVQQDEQRPILGDSPPETTKNELEAYHVGSIIEKHLGAPGSQSAIEAIRAEHANPGVPFVPTFSILHAVHTSLGSQALDGIGYRQVSANPPRYEAMR